jgi:hypothetical protein
LNDRKHPNVVQVIATILGSMDLDLDVSATSSIDDLDDASQHFDDYSFQSAIELPDFGTTMQDSIASANYVDDPRLTWLQSARSSSQTYADPAQDHAFLAVPTPHLAKGQVNDRSILSEFNVLAIDSYIQNRV